MSFTGITYRSRNYSKIVESPEPTPTHVTADIRNLENTAHNLEALSG